MKQTLFGTDGIRGRAGEGWLDTANTARIALAVARHVLETRGEDAPRPRALLGHDGRRSGPELLTAFARGLGSAGFELENAGLIPTPGLALLARRRAVDLGVMVSASHNPAEDNGIKLFGPGGEKFSDDDERAIEAGLHGGRMVVPEVEAPPVDPTLSAAYATAMVASAQPHLELDGMSVVVDCANGAMSEVAPDVLTRLGASVHAIHCIPDGVNINLACGSTHPESLQAGVLRAGAAMGFALDGDGDRCVLVDERGNLVDGDALLALLARHAVSRAEWRDRRVVATVMSNKGLARALRDLDISVLTVDVGDRNVVAALRREGLALGGEQSGHIVFGADNDYIGDGLYTALRVLRVMLESGSSLSELSACFRALPQVLLNVPVGSKPALDGLSGVTELRRSIEEELGQDGRVLLRYSGTESLARVMIEGPDLERIQGFAKDLAARIVAEIGA